MRYRIFLALLLVLPALAPRAFAQNYGAQQNKRSLKHEDAAPSKELLQKVMDGWATLDPANAAPFYDSAPEDIFFDLAPFKYQGWEEYARGVPQFLKDYKSLKVSVGDDAKVHRQGNQAWATASWHADGEKKDGSKDSIDARWTVVWQRKAGHWLIVHDHNSVPVQSQQEQK